MADLNTNNPLVLRTVDGKMEHIEHDNNFRNLMRTAGVWDSGRVPYQKNEVVTWDGFTWVALIPTSLEPLAANAGTAWGRITGFNGVGAMDLSAPELTDFTIGAGWDDLEGYDVITVPVIGCTLDTVTGYFRINYPGVWELSLTFFALVTDSTQGRTYQLRLRNVTQAIDGNPITVGLGRNTSGINVSIPVPFVADETILGNDYVMQIGNASSNINVEELDMLQLMLKQIAV